jgi:class 3 adenylate cyclase
MTELTAAHPTAHPEDSTTGRVQYAVCGKVQVNTDRINRVVSELSSSTHDILRRHRLTYAEYDALKAQLVHAGADSEWTAVTGAVTDIVRARMPARSHECRPHRVLATVLFTDIVDSTQRAAELGDRDWLKLLDRHDDIIRTQIATFRGRVVRHTGDGAVAIFDGPSCAVQSAAALTESIPELGIGIRCGLHTGECELRGDDIGGIAVHTGARIAALAHAGEVLVSNTVKDLVNGSGIAFQERGTHLLKGVPGAWRLFACS